MNELEIKEQFDKVIAYSQDIANPQTDYLFREWRINKRKFIDWFGGKPIYEIPLEKIRFELSDESKDNLWQNFVEDIYMHEDLRNFVIWNGVSNFWDNVVRDNYILLSAGKEIPKGMRLLKSFKFFISNSHELERIQNKASEYFQTGKLEGTLCFSVHPLDFLSSSENTLRWRSCHSLDGEYRVGNLSYMCDSSTIICYLKTDKDEQLPHFPSDVPWNNKKWRCLLHFEDNNNAVMAGRQYPFFVPNALDVIYPYLMHLIPEAHPRCWSRWHNEHISSTGYDDKDDWFFEQSECWVPLDKRFYRLDELIEDAPNSLHFNDLLYSSCYFPYYIFRHNASERKLFHFTIGAEVPCLECREELILSRDTNMRCDQCENNRRVEEEEEAKMFMRFCASCGTVEPDYLMRQINDEDWVCSRCYVNEVVECAGCGIEFLIRDADVKDEEIYCQHCMERMKSDGERSDCERESDCEDSAELWF